MSKVVLLLLACGSEPSVPAESQPDVPPVEASPAPSDPEGPAQVIEGPGELVIEVELGAPWGALQLPLGDGAIKRISETLLVVDYGTDVPPLATADAWCSAINASGATCRGQDPGLPPEAYSRTVMLGADELKLKVVKVMGHWLVMLTPPPPPRRPDGAG